jgi:hypothetical protein
MKLLFLSYGLSTLLLAETGSLRGVVTDATGAAVPAATVTLVGEGPSPRVAVADPKGAYAFTNLVPGAYTLQASARQLVLAPEQIKSDLDVLPELEELWAGHLEKIFSNPTAAV